MDGILVVNKDSGYTSRDVVNIISKKLKTKKIGHTGTLDPMAKGVLVLCINKGLKLISSLNEHDKEYVAKLVIGYETDTLDITGKITGEKYKDITKEMVIDVLNKFKGNIKQEVPKYSAVKVKGKRLYDYARDNIDVALPVKDVYIRELSLISDIVKLEKGYEFSIKCYVSKGTYIRSLIRDIGYALGSLATMSELTRTKVGDFSLDNSYRLEDILDDNYSIIKIDDIIKCPKVNLNDEKIIFKVINGAKIENKNNYEKVAFYNNNKLIAIYKKDKDMLKVDKMFYERG